MTDHAEQDASGTRVACATGKELESVACARLEQAVRHGSLAVALIDREGAILDANLAFQALLPDQALEGASLRLQSLFSPDDPRLATRLGSDAAGTIRLEHERGVLALSVGARQPEGRIVTLTPFLDPPRGEEAARDPLTGLGNRVALQRILTQWQGQAETDAARVVLMIDLDRFKQVNDTLGHPIGDDLLVHVARRLERTVGQPGTVLRLGGDEMMVVYRDDDYPVHTEQLAKRIVTRLARTFLIGGHQIDISASVGISRFDSSEGDTSRLLMHADLALYAAKSAGRDQYRFFESHLEEAARARREMEVRLRRALVRDEFRLVYQPQVSLEDGSVSGFEALIRWETEDRGVIMPAEFIELAEEIGEIHAIGEWVIRTACREAAGWEEGYSVAVNVSPLQFESGRLIEIVRSALSQSGLAPQRLELEVTESALIDKTRQILTQLWTLREMGVCIAMDDFGTGYSSLGYLRSFPFSRLKIDQSFVGGTPDDQSRALVDAILLLAHELGMTTIAEGVETEEQHAILTQSGCARAQGYLFAPPMPPEAIVSYCAGVARQLAIREIDD
ncbi:putative bifunctional diguanylate cyclase/phosphodiesterase [Salinicola halophilus]|uniref:putative bifunctional diguanylate cyclase/phosphodiesterase n=1 Tax=Salinicola halophilus TaxID=184065 RepID=UPI000DA1C764|nr:bifunctional diguanylate cyclase/phosphodiesterase [Salinicola halophilus]